MSSNVTHPLIIWNEFKGTFDVGIIAQIRHDKYGPGAHLGAPFDEKGPGWFSLDELLKSGSVSMSGYRVLLFEQWKKDEGRLREKHLEWLEKHRNQKTFQRSNPFQTSNPMSRERRLLGLPLTGSVTRAQVKTAFEKTVKAGHPDSGGTGNVDMA